MPVTSPEHIRDAIVPIDVDQYRFESILRREERRYRWYVSPAGLVVVPSLSAPAPMHFTEWQPAAYYETTEKIVGPERSLGKHAILATRGIELATDTTDKAVEAFYESGEDSDKRFFSEFTITPLNNFPPIRKQEIRGVIEFDTSKNRNLGVKALKAVCFNSEPLLDDSREEEFQALYQATFARYDHYVGVESEKRRAFIRELGEDHLS